MQVIGVVSPISAANRRKRSTGTCESCWSSPKLWPRDIVRGSHSHSRCSTVSLPLRRLLHKGFMSFPIQWRWPYWPRCPVSRPTTMDSCCLLMFSSLEALIIRYSRGNVLASRAKVCGFKPEWGRWIFSGCKNSEHTSSRRDVKLRVPSLIFQAR